MPRYRYMAFDVRGVEKAGETEAGSTEAAELDLKARGLFPTEIVPLSGALASAAGVAATTATVVSAGRTPARPRWGDDIRLPFLASVRPKELASFTRQLGTLTKAGMPLLRGLEVLARQERNRAFRCILEALADDIRSGGSLSEAMARHPRVFDRLYVNMIKAGEAGGVLDVVLERLADFQEKSLALRGKVTAALVYPVIVMGVAVLILAGLLVFVVPKFQQIFADLLKGAPLPPLTEAVLAVSDAVQRHFVACLVALVVAQFAYGMLRRTRAGARLVDGLKLRLPLFGEFYLKSLVARFTRTLGTLVSSGVPILQAIVITRDTTGNTVLGDALDLVHDAVKQGESVAAPLAASNVFPAMLTSMIDVGEHTGQLPAMLNKVADIYDGEVDTAVAGLSSMIEPLLVLFLAAVVGTIVLALFLPIIRIVQMLT